ncbi:MAG: 16S rRNA (guanine(966)-N(2))-methyltransferase RsmD [Candidatus Cloacimonetes bacterium]|nr:16S rRNA (guanine(966)-N(2))-methyltransferase RsmD [Candidatus Cloacimonadota bacterium]
MRIITGKYKKSNLFAVPGFTARPTTDFTREVIFTVLNSCQNLQVLDIYAGSGSLGLEALSRGARFVDFVDFSEKSIRTMIKNVHKLGCKLDCKIHRKKVSAFLKSCDKKFDIILMDPPYDRMLVNKTIKQIFDNELLAENGRLVIEHSSREKIDPIWQDKIDYQRDSKKTQITIIK